MPTRRGMLCPHCRKSMLWVCYEGVERGFLEEDRYFEWSEGSNLLHRAHENIRYVAHKGDRDMVDCCALCGETVA